MCKGVFLDFDKKGLGFMGVWWGCCGYDEEGVHYDLKGRNL